MRRSRSDWAKVRRTSSGRVVGRVQLRGEEDILARDAAGRDPFPDAGLVAIHLCRVDVPVADLCEAKRRPVRRRRWGNLVGAKTELRGCSLGQSSAAAARATAS